MGEQPLCIATPVLAIRMTNDQASMTNLGPRSLVIGIWTLVIWKERVLGRWTLDLGLWTSVPGALVEDFLGHVDRQDRVAGDSHGDRVAGPRVDLDQLPLALDPQLGE